MTGDAQGGEKLGVFISYSRDDLVFADQLDATLKIGGFDTRIDRTGIHGGEKWELRLGTLIRDADTVVFVLSPSSAGSKVCEWEVRESVRLGKRIIPVACRPLDGASPPSDLAAINYIYFYSEPDKPGSGFGAGLLELVTALKTDLDWLREHTRLLQRASEWDAMGRTESRLLFGDSIGQAKAWAARRPKDAPEPTALHYEYIRASEEAEARRQNEERQQLEQMAAAQAERAKALTEKEQAQKREAEQARRVVQRTRAGLIAALALAAVAGLLGSYAHLRRLEVAEANQRLSAEMKLRIAPFGKEAYTISEQWYKLATTNASSIAFIETLHDNKPFFHATGFIVKGRSLYEPWGDEALLVTAGHVIEYVKSGQIYFPAVDANYKVKLGDVKWKSEGNVWDVDVAIVRLARAPPRGARYVEAISDLDIGQLGLVSMLAGESAVAGSVLPDPLPFVILGASIDQSEDLSKARPALTLSLANALGRVTKGVDKIVFTDSTTIGSSGSPVFDANDGRLIAIMQFGGPRGYKGDGLAYSGGVTMALVKKSIQAEPGIREPLR